MDHRILETKDPIGFKNKLRTNLRSFSGQVENEQYRSSQRLRKNERIILISRLDKVLVCCTVIISTLLNRFQYLHFSQLMYEFWALSSYQKIHFITTTPVTSFQGRMNMSLIIVKKTGYHLSNPVLSFSGWL